MNRCPTCNSPAPHLHPAMQFEGEVQTCDNAYHLIPTNQNRAAIPSAGGVEEMRRLVEQWDETSEFNSTELYLFTEALVGASRAALGGG